MIGKADKKGFTLIEILMATAIFLVIFVIILDLTVLFTRHPEQIIRQKKLENEMSYTMDFIAQKIRMNKIDYSAYDVPLTSPSDALNLVDKNGYKSSFSLTAQGILNYSYNPVHSNEIVIDSARYYIDPVLDPYCDTFATGAYQACGSNSQPLVTINISAHHKDDPSLTQVLQTTILSRVYER